MKEIYGQACASPTCREWSNSTHQLHPIDGNCSNGIITNLVLLCLSCHGRATTGIISQSDLMLWQRMAASKGLPAPKGQPPAYSLNIQTNNGVAAQTVNIGTYVHNQKQKGTVYPPGTLGADIEMRTYSLYLVKRYIEWRIKGQVVDSRKFNPASAHGILAEGFGSPSSVLFISQSRFFDWIVQAQSKINNTAFGRINRRNLNRNFHTWEDHLKERRGTSDSLDSQEI